MQNETLSLLWISSSHRVRLRRPVGRSINEVPQCASMPSSPFPCLIIVRRVSTPDLTLCDGVVRAGWFTPEGWMMSFISCLLSFVFCLLSKREIWMCGGMWRRVTRGLFWWILCCTKRHETSCLRPCAARRGDSHYSWEK
jgi:hypothetical protein